MEKARRRHVPAFGEWNYYSSPDEPEPEPPRYGGAAVDWRYVPVPGPDACSDVWFRYSPPPRKPAPKKAKRRPEPCGERAAVATPAEKLRYYDGGKGALARASGRGDVTRTPVNGGGRRVVRPVDKDLYQVPPPDFSSGRPRRKRSVLMDCFGGLSCVA